MFRSLAGRTGLLAFTLFAFGVVGPLAGQTNTPRGEPIGPRQANRSQPPRVNRAQPRAVVRAPFQLTPERQEHLDSVLKWWEHTSSKVTTYQCAFTRYEYDAVFGPKNPKFAKTISTGVIRYAAPDKGQFHVETIARFKAPPQKPGEQPQYTSNKTEHGEHWVSDGKAIYEFKSKTKQLIETKLPPHLQGTAITDGPLPFLFGAKADKLKQRYWIREHAPPAGAVEYWLEAYPKTRQDAANFQRVEVILNKDFLPTALQLYPPNYDKKSNPSRTAYRFDNRKVNNRLHQVQGFMNSFVRPRLPSGWNRHVEDYGDATATAGTEPPQQRGRQAQGPTQKLPR